MLELLNRVCLAVGDALFGRLLALSPSLALVAVALGTSLLMTVVRRYTTNQNLLARAAADKRRLKQLAREAKQRRDAAALARHRATLAQLGLVQLAAEGKPLLASLLPIALLATWCFQRLEYLPPRGGETISLALHTPAPAVASLVHLVPCDNLRSPAWIQRVEAEPPAENEQASGGVARWRLVASPSSTPYTLTVRAGERTLAQPLLVGQPTYLAGETNAGEGWRTVVELEPFRLFGVVPGLDCRQVPVLAAIPGLKRVVLAPWLVGYLLLVIPLALLLKPALRIY